MSDEAWLNELAFSNWLHANLHCLTNVLGVELHPRVREARVGGFSADLLATTANDNPVIIENQIFKADHSHFGQVMTYAAFYDAAIIVWIARTFRNEYREAIGWLNRLSRKQFFAVELSGSGPADCGFSVVAGPSSRVAAADTQPVVMSPLPAATEQGEDAAYIPAPYAVRLPAQPRANISPDQVVLNGIFEDVASRIAALALTRPRKPRVDRNFSVFAGGPVKDSEWALTFEGDNAAVALVFFGADAHERAAQVKEHAKEIERASGLTFTFDVKPPEQRIKQKVMVYRHFPVAGRDGQREEIVVWAAATFETFYNVLLQFCLFTPETVQANA